MMRYAFLLCMLAVPAFAADKPLPWVELVIFSNGKIVENRFSTQPLCLEAKSYSEFGKSIADKAAADKQAEDNRKKREADYQKSVADWRVTHPCSEAMDDVYDITTDSPQKKTKALRYHCSMPDGGENAYDKSGALTNQITNMNSSSGSISFSPYIAKAVCFKEDAK